MIDDIILTNLSTDGSIAMHRGSGPYVIDEIDWDSPAVSMSTYRVPFQVGSTLSGVTVGTRKPSIIGYVIADLSDVNVLGMTMTEYYAEQLRQIEEAKAVLNKLINVYQDLRIEADGYYLVGRPTMPVKYSTKEDENNDVLCQFEIEMECYDPLFLGESKTVALASAEPMFHFPMINTEEKGDLYTVFGSILNRQTMEVMNNGDADVGCEIKITAIAGVSNPRVYNVGTNEFIEFENVTMESGDIITVNTNVKEERAVWHDASENRDISIVGNLKDGSTFFKIMPGSGLYAYSVPEGYENNVEIMISYTEKYFNLTKM